MAVPSYTNDLTLIVDFDTTSGTLAEPSTGWTAGRSPVQDTDFPIQGTDHASLTMNSTGKAGIVSTASSFTWTTGHYLFGWLNWWAPSTIATRTSGGLAMLAGSSTSNYKVFYVGGSDYGSYPYGGWQNFAVDPTATGDETYGTPTGYYTVGAGANVLTKVAKGNPLGFDVFRYGRGEFRVSGGSGSGGYATFSGMAAVNDASLARWGLFQEIEGGYKAKGLMILGYGAATEFTDNSKNIVFDTCMYVNSDFNQIEIRNASSVINWSGVNITQLGVNTTSGYDTVSQCALKMTDNATVNFGTCTFTDMSTFTFLSNATLTGTTFKRCGIVTTGSGSFSKCLFTNATGSSAVSSTTLGDISDSSFESSGTGIGVDISGTTISASTGMDWNNTSSGYTDTSGNRTIKVRVDGSAILTINNNTGDTLYVENAGTSTAGANGNGVEIVTGQRTMTFNINPTPTDYEYRIYTVTTAGSLVGASELQGSESTSLSSQSYTYSYSPGVIIAFQVLDHSDIYEESVTYYTLADADTTQTINLKVDTND